MFGSTKCGKCENSSFKLQQIEARDAAYKMFTIQCTSCQTPIGITDYYNVGSLVKQQEASIKELQSKLKNVEYIVTQIAHVLNNMRR